MNIIGQIIKRERLKQNLKQVNLAHGICSVSYLSKIEANLTQPSDEILNLLLERLNISLNELSRTEETQYIQKILSFYKEAVLSQDKTYTFEQLSKEFNDSVQFSADFYYYTFTLYMFRLYLISDTDIEILREFVDVIESFNPTIGDKEWFIANHNLAIFYYNEHDYAKSLSHLETALGILDTLPIEEWEKADFYNTLSLAYVRNNDLPKSNYYASLSLQIFRKQLILNRAIDSYIILGNNAKRIGDFRNAEHNYILAQKLAKDLKLEAYEGMIAQNLGSLSASIGEHDKAIEYYTSSLSRKKKDAESYYLTVFSIIKEYSKEENHIQVLNWCKHGLENITSIKEKSTIQPYQVHFKLYQSLHSNDEELEAVLKKSIKYFEKLGDNRQIQKYSFLIAEYYTKQLKYKSAVTYYEKAKQILFKDKSIQHWEDL